MGNFLRLVIITIACALLFTAPIPLSAETYATNTSAAAEAAEQARKDKIVGEVVEKIKDFYHRELTEEELIDIRIRCSLALEQDPSMEVCMARLDPHSSYMTPDKWIESQEDMQGLPFGGVGLSVEQSENPPGILIEAPTSGGPSERAGVQAQDMIIEIEVTKENGRKVMQSTAGMTLKRAVELLRGEVNTTVRFVVKREGHAEPIPFTITRELIKVSLVSKKELKRTSSGNFGYIRLTSFRERATSEVRSAILALSEESKKNNGQPLSGLILDLRDNPGGLLGEANGVQDLFLSRDRYKKPGRGFGRTFDSDAATTVQTESRGRIEPEHITGSARDVIDGAPLVILVNGRSASASEIVSGVSQKHGRAIVAGVERSYGKGTVQTIIPLPHGGALRLTISQYLIGSVGCATPVQGVGITPDILLKRRPDEKPTRQHEEDRERSLATSTVSSANCRYNFGVPTEHRKTALIMLRAFGLEPIDTSQE